MFFAIVSKHMEFMMSVDDFYVFFVRLFSKIIFPQKHHFSKGLGGCRWEVFDLKYIGRGDGVRGWGRECDFYLGGSGASAIANFLF